MQAPYSRVRFRVPLARAFSRYLPFRELARNLIFLLSYSRFYSWCVRKIKALTICMENLVIQERIQMERFIPFETF